jgi:Carbohydrate-binding module 48 (Isoamylase N-terminal domain)
MAPTRATKTVAKSKSIPKTVDVVFSLPVEVAANKVALCGDFNGWSTDGILLEQEDGAVWSAKVPLQIGQTYRFRYLCDGERWENAWVADGYVPNPFGSDDSIVVVA